MAIPGLTRARSWLFDVFAHHHAERLRTNRAVERKVRGLENMEDLPYPGAISGSGNPTTINAGSGWLKGAILGAALLAGGGAAVIGLGVLTPPSAPSTTRPVALPPTSKAPTRLPGWDAIYEVQDPATGQWKQTRREHLTP